MTSLRKIFIVVAGGNLAAEKHFEDTIQRKRTVSEVRQFLPENEIRNLENIYHNSQFIVWGAVPGKMNEPRWEKMEPGDLVLIYNRGHIRVIGEIAAKVRSKELARYFWKETELGDTWELMYFMVNEKSINIPLAKLNPFFGYKENYAPQGFSMINEEAVADFAKNYGDLLGVLETLEKGEEIISRPIQQPSTPTIDEQVERVTTEHDEMQWKLLHLGKLGKLDIWLPRNDQGKQYEGRNFSDFVLPEFHESLDVPTTIKNIDVVWKFGPYSIKSAFEIENSTAIYSGILRLSDLRALSPNSNYPLFIVAAEERRRKVIEELMRPTFSGPCLRLNEVIRYLGYKKIREIYETYKNTTDFDSEILLGAGESI